MLKNGGFNRMEHYCHHARRNNVGVLHAVLYYFVGKSRGPGLTTK